MSIVNLQVLSMGWLVGKIQTGSARPKLMVAPVAPPCPFRTLTRFMNRDSENELRIETPKAACWNNAFYLRYTK